MTVIRSLYSLVGELAKATGKPQALILDTDRSMSQRRTHERLDRAFGPTVAAAVNTAEDLVVELDSGADLQAIGQLLNEDAKPWMPGEYLRINIYDANGELAVTHADYGA